jgi:MFS transporter, PPP family, 3-phenylpropionic acid transporter
LLGNVVEASMQQNRNQLTALKTFFFFFGGANVLIGPFLPIYLTHQGFSPAKVGLILGVATFCGVVAQPFWAYMSDRYKTVKKILLILIIACLALSAGLFFSNVFLIAILFALLFYLVWSPIGVLTDSLAIKTVSISGESYGNIRLWSSVGFAGFAILAGPLLERFGIQWLYLYFWLLLIIMVISLKPIHDHNESSKAVELRDVKELVKNREFAWFLLLIFFLSIPFGFNSMFTLYMKDLGAGEKLIGLATMISAGSEVPFFYFLTKYVGKHNELFLLSIVSLLYTFRWFITAIIVSPLILTLFQITQGVTFAAFWLISLQFVVRIVPDYLRGTGQSLLAMMCFGVVSIFGNIVGGWFFESFGGQKMYMMMGMVASVATILFFITFRFQQKQKHRIQEESGLVEKN